MGFVGSYIWRLRQRVGSELILAPGASILVEDPDGRVLLERREDSDMWCMPGGAADEGDSFASTAIRELEEETGLVAEVDDLIAFACISDPATHTLKYANGDVTHAFAMWFVLRRWSGRLLKQSEETEEIHFFLPKEIPANTLKPSLRALELYKRFMETGQFQVS